MYNTPDLPLEQPMNEVCSDCGYPLSEDGKGPICLYCKEWAEKEIIAREAQEQSEEDKADEIIKKVSRRYPKAEIELTMPSGNKYIKQ